MIAFDARMIGHSGIGTYIRGLFSGFTHDQLGQMALMGDPQLLSGYPCQPVVSRERIYGLSEQTALPMKLSKMRPDLLHVPHYNIPLLHRGPLVATVHDLNHVLFPELSRSRFAKLYARGMIACLVKKAARIITVSETVKADLVRFGAPAEKIIAVPLAVESRFRPVLAESAGVVWRKFNLSPGYLLYVGNLRPIKNIPRLLSGYKALKAQHRDAPPLVLAGENQMPGPLRDFMRDPAVRFLGQVDGADLPALYSGAGVFVFPSLYEGFGFPPLEAMACGCPVLASDRGSLPEVLGDAALFVNPLDEEKLAAGMDRILSDSGLRSALREKGLRRAAQFSWASTARRTFQIYQEVQCS